MKKTNFLLLALAILSMNFAKAEEQQTQVKFEQGNEISPGQLPAEYNAPARYDLKGDWDFFFSGSFIFWQPRERGLDFTQVEPATGTIKSKKIDLNYKFKPGFKAALGFAGDSDAGWLMGVEYTWLNCRESKRISVDPASGEVLSASWGWYNRREFTPYYARGKWKLNYNIFDASFARPFYSGTMLTIRPHAGFRGGWINQRYNVIYQGSTDDYINPRASEKTWLFGPRIGFNSDWLLGAGFRFFATTAGSLMYQHFKTHYYWDYTPGNPPVDTAFIKEKTYAITPCFEAGCGFGWGCYYGDNNWGHFDLKVGYDFQVFGYQNTMRALKDGFLSSVNFYDTNLGNLMLQGLTITMQFDF